MRRDAMRHDSITCLNLVTEWATIFSLIPIHNRIIKKWTNNNNKLEKVLSNAKKKRNNFRQRSAQKKSPKWGNVQKRRNYRENHNKIQITFRKKWKKKDKRQIFIKRNFVSYKMLRRLYKSVLCRVMSVGSFYVNFLFRMEWYDDGKMYRHRFSYAKPQYASFASIKSLSDSGYSNKNIKWKINGVVFP